MGERRVVFAESGAHQAGPLRFEIVESPKTTAANHSSPVTRHSSLRSGNNIAATVWVSSLDGAPIPASSHLLVTHLTDIQNSGIEYADSNLTTLLRWGSLPHIMRNGSARIELQLNAREANDGALRANDGGALRQMTKDNNSVIAGAAGPVIAAEDRASLPLEERPVIDGGGAAAIVYRLSSSGKRLGEVPVTWDSATGRLSFTASTDYDPTAATYLYEIVREAR